MPAALLLFVFLFVFFMYTFLHEEGHAVTGWLFGQSLTEFNMNFLNFSAHVSLAGGELTQTQLAVQSAAGATLPFLIWTIFIGLVPRKSNFIVEALKLISSMAVVNTLLAWIILPALFLFGKAPSDDVTNFLDYSQVSPLLLMFAAIVLYIGGWLLFLSKIDGLRNEFLLFSRLEGEKLISGTRMTLSSMAGLLVLCILTVLIFNSSAEKNSLNKFSPPHGFVPVAELDLSQQAYTSEKIAQFSLDKPAYIGVYVAVHNINTNYFDLRVTGTKGFSSIVLHGEGYSALRDGGLWKENLPAGTYQLVLTSHQSSGTASVYLRVP
jgi:hypothetical protein